MGELDKEIYKKRPETEEAARIQLTELYTDLAEGATITVRRVGFVTAVLYGIGLSSLVIAKLVGTDAATVKNMAATVSTFNNIGGTLLLGRLVHYMNVKRDMLKKRKKAINGEFENYMDEVNLIIDDAERVRNK